MGAGLGHVWGVLGIEEVLVFNTLDLFWGYNAPINESSLLDLDLYHIYGAFTLALGSDCARTKEGRSYQARDHISLLYSRFLCYW